MTSQSKYRWSLSSWDTLSRDELYTILQLRQQIFVVEQNCPYLDADGTDHKALHLQGYAQQELCAYARIFPPKEKNNTVVIGRVIVAQHFRGRGLGKILMQKSHELSYEQFPQCRFFLSAQSHLSSFYGDLGYQQCGEGYLEDDIPHIPMMKHE